MATFLMPIGLLILLLVAIRDRHILKIDLKAVQTFITLMILLTFFRFTMASVLAEMGVNVAQINKGLAHIPFWRLALVFWEDAFFAIPIYYMKDKWKWSRYLWMPVVAILSVTFAIGHIYQGQWAFFATLLVPYVIWYRYGKRFGFGTVMICHILFDQMTILAFRMLNYVVL